jgi:hypothetical protein
MHGFEHKYGEGLHTRAESKDMSQIRGVWRELDLDG